jgi:hypothetical protein
MILIQSWREITSGVREEDRMVSSGLLRRVALVRTDVSEEPGASYIKQLFNQFGMQTIAVASDKVTWGPLVPNSPNRI